MRLGAVGTNDRARREILCQTPVKRDRHATPAIKTTTTSRSNKEKREDSSRRRRIKRRLLLLQSLALLVGQIVVVLQLTTITPAHAYCDKTFSSTGESNADNSTSRNFVAPNGVKAKLYAIYKNRQGSLVVSRNFGLASQQVLKQQDNKTAKEHGETAGKAFHCLYKFVARENERVAVSFSSFRLRGDEPECNREYVDIYNTITPNERFEDAIRRELPNGRFCTTIVPHKVLSLGNMLVLSIYSELEPPSDGRPLFTGSYEFIKAKPDEQNIGPPEEGSLCTHTIRSSERREGEFQSVTYPGVYTKNLRCSYTLVGEPEQRIRLEFLDLDLYSGGSHCPLDSIKIFDGTRETDPLIQTICGSHRSLIIFSTRESLLVTFNTLQREVEIQDRGFSAYFEFSDKFYDPSFIVGPNARHVRGTECDQRIVSAKGSSGYITSPGPKRDHTNAICRYFFEGLQSTRDYEKVELKFTEFDLKTPGASGDSPTSTAAPPTPTTTTTTTSTISPLLLLNQTLNVTNRDDSNSPNVNGTSPDQCPDNYVRIYTSEQKPDQKQDPNDYDYVFCGNEVPTSPIESDAASMLMEYNSGSIGGAFKAEYTFIVDFRIPGYQASPGCNFVYRSDLAKTGTFNSPRHPSWYINDLNCSFTFLTKSDEALLMQFTTVNMARSFTDKTVGMNQNCTGEDSIVISETSLDANDSKVVDQYEIGTYCGNTRPGPILRFRPVQVLFKPVRETPLYGFSAIYHFYSKSALRTNEFVANCGGQIQASHRQRSGTIVSPDSYRSITYEKRNHYCSWNITARPAYRIALDFEKFELEGNTKLRGCATASVRLEFGRSQLPKELCGSFIFPTSNATLHHFVSEDEWLVVTFISTKLASGSNGFSATWTEINPLLDKVKS